MTYAKLDIAIQMAARYHAGQERDGDNPLPYITHPIEVLMNLRTIGGVIEEDLLCAAVLHDVLEETKTSPNEILMSMGPGVLSLVQELTRREPSAEETNGLSKDEIWQLRSKMLLAEIAIMSPQAQAIKLADRLANLRDARYTRSGTKLNRYKKQTALILNEIQPTVNVRLWKTVRAELTV